MIENTATLYHTARKEKQNKANNKGKGDSRRFLPSPSRPGTTSTFLLIVLVREW